MASIAQELGVSRTTVSLVLKGEGERYRIADETRNRILELAQKLEYRPCGIATALATGRSGVTGVVLPNLHEPYMVELVRGIQQVLEPQAVVMMVGSSNFDPGIELRTLEAFSERGVDAFIFMPYAPFRGFEHDLEKPFRYLQSREIPVVCIDRAPAFWKGILVRQDDRGAAGLAVRSLAARGARRIALLSFDLVCPALEDRIAGYREAIHHAGLLHDDRLELFLHARDRSGTDLQLALENVYSLPRDEQPDAFFVTTNGLSYRLAALASGLGQKPLIAKSGSDHEYWDTGMIAIRQPHESIGNIAAQLILARLQEARGESRSGSVSGSEDRSGAGVVSGVGVRDVRDHGRSGFRTFPGDAVRKEVIVDSGGHVLQGLHSSGQTGIMSGRSHETQ